MYKSYTKMTDSSTTKRWFCIISKGDCAKDARLSVLRNIIDAFGLECISLRWDKEEIPSYTECISLSRRRVYSGRTIMRPVTGLGYAPFELMKQFPLSKVHFDADTVKKMVPASLLEEIINNEIR